MPRSDRDKSADQQRHSHAGSTDDRDFHCRCLRCQRCLECLRVGAISNATCFLRRLRADLVAGAQAFHRRSCRRIHATRKPALNESPAPVVSTTFTRGAGKWMSRSGASHIAPLSPCLTMTIALRWRQCVSAPSSVGFAGVEPRLELVDEDEIERVDQIGQPAIARQRLVPAEIPRRGDAALAEPGDDPRPEPAVVRVEAEVNVSRSV